MAPITRESGLGEKPQIFLAQELPVHNQPTAPRSPRVSPRKLIASVFLFLITISMLHKPLSHCYHRAHGHFCRKLSVEQRARKVLSTTPLIGESNFLR